MTQEAQVVKWNCPCGNSYKFHGFTESPQRTWVGLTDEEINKVLGGDIHDEPNGLLEFVRAIEAKLKEKNI